MKSLDYLKLIVGTKAQFYQDCEVIVHLICTAAVYFGVESILESFVSMRKHRINLHRAGKISEEWYSQELSVYINGPPVNLCKPLVKEAMNKYWHEKTFQTGTTEWHFTRKSGNVKNYTVSKVVDRHLAEKCSFSFLFKKK